MFEKSQLGCRPLREGASVGKTKLVTFFSHGAKREMQPKFLFLNPGRKSPLSARMQQNRSARPRIFQSENNQILVRCMRSLNLYTQAGIVITQCMQMDTKISLKPAAQYVTVCLLLNRAFQHQFCLKQASFQSLLCLSVVLFYCQKTSLPTTGVSPSRQIRENFLRQAVPSFC